MITVFDIEANGLIEDVSQVWCWAALVDSGVDGQKLYSGRDVQQLLNILGQSDIIVGHNIIGYDLPLLMKLYNWKPHYKEFNVTESDHIFDTLVASHLLHPDLPSPQGWVGKPKPHSIEAWAMRFGKEQKVEIEDWSEFTEDMMQRCKVDVKITYMLYKRLMEKLNE